MSSIGIDVKINPVFDANEFNRILASMKAGLGDFGKTIRPIDASQFEKAFEGAKKGAKGVEDGLEGAGNSAKKLPGILDGALGKLFAMNQATTFVKDVASGISDLAKPYTELDTATQSMRTLGGEATKLADPLRAASIVMSKDLPFAAAELQTTMFDALASGVKGGEAGLKSFAETAGKLAVGGASGIGDATGLLAGQLNAYGESAEAAARYSDILFNTVNYGVTSIPQLSTTLANVIPTASGLGVELENVGAALAVMTSKGIPTAQSTTKLNALLLEIAKPGAALAPILKQAGVSLDSLKKDDLPVTLGKINEALKATGKASVEVFSSSEAGAAFATLAGDIGAFQQTFDDVKNTAGSSQLAYEAMSDSIGVKTKQALSYVNSLVIGGFDLLGNSVVAAAQTATQLAPMVTTMAGLGAILPTDKILTFSSSMIQKLIPSLFTTVAVNGATTTSFIGMGAAASAAWAAATGPVGLVVLAIGAVVGAMVLLYNYVDGFREIVDKVFNYVAQTMSGVVAVFDSLFGDSGESAGDAFKKGFEEKGNQLKLDKAKENMKAELEGLKDLNVEVDANINAQSLVDDFQKTQKEIDALKSKATTQSLTTDEQAQLDELVKKSEQAKEKLGELAPSAIKGIKTVTDANGNLKQVYDINIDAAKKLIDAQSSGATGKVAEAQKKYSSGLLEQMSVYDAQKAKLLELGNQITQTSDPKKVQQLTAEYNKQKSEVDNTKKALTQSFQEGGKAGLVTKDALDKVSGSLKMNSSEAKKSYLASALTEASAKGKLTETQVASIAKRYNSTKEEAQLLLKAQEDNTSEAGKTAEAAKSIGDAYSEATKASKATLDKAKSEMAGLTDQIDKAKKAGDYSRVAELQAQYKIQEDLAVQADKELDTAENITKSIDKKFENKKENSKAEKKSALEQFEIDLKSNQAKLDSEKIDRERLRISQGLSLSSEDELEFAQNQTKEYERQVQSLNELAISKKNDSKASKEIADKLLDVNKSLEQSKLAVDKIEFKINIDSTQLDKDLDRINEAVARKNIEANIKLGIQSDSDLVKFDIESLTKEIVQLNTEMNSAKAQNDKKYLAELNAKVIENQNAINFKKLELEQKHQDFLLSAIANDADRQRAKIIAEAEKTYQEILKQANGNRAIEYRAFLDFLAKKQAAEEEYANKTMGRTTKIYIDAANSLSLAFSDTSFEYNSNAEEESKKSINAIDAETEKLEESFRNRLLARTDYVNKIQELEAKRIEAETKMREKELNILDAFANSLSKSFASLKSKSIDNINDTTKAYFESAKKHSQNDALMKQKSDKLNEAKAKGDIQLEAKISDEISKLRDAQSEADLERNNLLAESYANAAVLAGSSFATMILSGENAMKALVLSSLDALQALVPVLVAQIFGTSFATLGPIAGAFASAGTIVAFQGLIALAKASAQSFHTGGVFGVDRNKGGLLKGPQSTAMVTYNELGEEFFMNHKATAMNLPHLKAINSRNITIEQYALENESIRNTVLRNYSVPDKIYYKIGALPIVEEKRNEQKESRIEAKLDEFLSKFSKKNTRTELYNELKVQVAFDSAKYMKDAERKKLSRIRMR